MTLLGRDGQCYCRAGANDEPGFEKTSIPAWLAAAAETEKNAQILSCTGRMLVFQTEKIEVVLVPLGTLTLVIGLKPGHNALRLALAMEEALAVQQELQSLIGEKPMRVQLEPLPLQPVKAIPIAAKAASVPEKTTPVQSTQPPKESLEELGDLEKLFHQPRNIGNQDLDAFWEKAASVRTSQGANQGAISYEQAMQLGLTPKP